MTRQPLADDRAHRSLEGPFVSPFDDRVRPLSPLAARPDGVAGRRVALLDITKNRGSELLDRLEALLAGEGATVSRCSKEIFSKPASAELIEQLARRTELLVEALAD